MNFAQGSLRLLLVIFLAWTVYVAVDTVAREIASADSRIAADCQISKDVVAGFDLRKCIEDPASSERKRGEVIAGAKNWFLKTGYIFWLVPPFLFTTLAIILIAAGAFVYRGFASD
jgi:hypothetical protein